MFEASVERLGNLLKHIGPTRLHAFKRLATHRRVEIESLMSKDKPRAGAQANRWKAERYQQVTWPSGKIRDEISLATVKSIADHCIAEAGARQLDAVVYIVNPGGYPVYVARADGLPPITVLVAEAKAKTAIVMRDSTHKWMNRAIEDPMFSDKMAPLGQHWNSGGLPIVVEGVLIGALGVGGLPALPDFDDEVCGYHALEAVIGPQPPRAPTLPPVVRR